VPSPGRLSSGPLGIPRGAHWGRNWHLMLQDRESSPDIWASWLLHRRDGGDARRRKLALERLAAIRDSVLDHASLKEGDTLLDVGCGDGLVGFGALRRTQTTSVIFSDISQQLLEHAKATAAEAQVLGRCIFLKAAAEDLSQLPDASVTAVTTRSVLIYVTEKGKAFREFFRVLQRGGRLSIFEPINRFGYPPQDHLFAGYDVGPVADIAAKVRQAYRRAQPDDTDPMLDFDERDLIRYAEDAGFEEIHLRLEADIEPLSEAVTWESFLKTAPNPLAPTLEEAMSEALSPADQSRFVAHLRPLVEANKGTRTAAVAYLWALKAGDA